MDDLKKELKDTFIGMSFQNTNSYQSVNHSVNQDVSQSVSACKYSGAEDAFTEDKYRYISVKDSGEYIISSEKSVPVEIHLPRGTKIVAPGEFKNCVNILAVYSNRTLESIGEGAFENCIGLESVSFCKSNLKDIGENAFKGCINLTAVRLSTYIDTISKYAFRDCIRLKSIYLPKSLSKISEGAFMNCKSISVVSLPALIREVPQYTFKGCAFLAKVSIPSGVRIIGRGSFQNCSRLKTINMNGSLNSLNFKKGAFAGCLSVESITLREKKCEKWARIFRLNKSAMVRRKVFENISLKPEKTALFMPRQDKNNDVGFICLNADVFEEPVNQTESTFDTQENQNDALNKAKEIQNSSVLSDAFSKYGIVRCKRDGTMFDSNADENSAGTSGNTSAPDTVCGANENAIVPSNEDMPSDVKISSDNASSENSERCKYDCLSKEFLPDKPKESPTDDSINLPADKLINENAASNNNNVFVSIFSENINDFNRAPINYGTQNSCQLSDINISSASSIRPKNGLICNAELIGNNYVISQNPLYTNTAEKLNANSGLTDLFSRLKTSQTISQSNSWDRGSVTKTDTYRNNQVGAMPLNNADRPLLNNMQCAGSHNKCEASVASTSQSNSYEEFKLIYNAIYSNTNAEMCGNDAAHINSGGALQQKDAAAKPRFYTMSDMLKQNVGAYRCGIAMFSEYINSMSQNEKKSVHQTSADKKTAAVNSSIHSVNSSASKK